MITLLTLSVVSVAALFLIGIVMLLVGFPLLIILGILPWFLKLAAVVLLIKGLLDRPFQPANLVPAGIAYLAAILIRWIF